MTGWNVKCRARECFRSLDASPRSSSENNRQPEQDDCDRHERRAGDVSEQDEEYRDNGEDCCDVVVHSFLSWVCRRYRVRLSGARFLNRTDFEFWNGVAGTRASQ
jgi:hypothetical protein